jgi:hypothetical protein
MAAQGQDPTEIVRRISEVISMRQKGKTIEDAIQEVFTTKNPPAGAQPTVEQPVPAAPGAPVGGSPSPEQGGQPQQIPGQAKPELQTLLSTLTGTGAARSSARVTQRRQV